MQISILQEILKPALAKAVKVTAGKTTLPVLNNVLLVTAEGRLHVSATNLEIGVSFHLGCKIKDEGSITLPAKLLADLVDGFPNGPITITTNDQDVSATITAGDFTTVMKGIEADEFPVMPTVTDRALVALDSDALRTGIEHVAFAAAGDNTRPVLAGVHLRLSDVLVALEAADGFRFSSYEFETVEPIAGLHDFIIPATTMNYLATLLAGDAVVELVASASGGQLLFHMEGVDVVTRLIEGDFPDVRRVLPPTFHTRMVVDVKDMARAAKLANPFSGENSRLYLAFGGEDATSILPGTLAISTTASEIGKYDTAIKGITAGKQNKIIVNNTFFLEALRAAGTEQIAIEVTEPQNPLVLREVGTNKAWTHVVMPIN